MACAARSAARCASRRGVRVRLVRHSYLSVPQSHSSPSYCSATGTAVGPFWHNAFHSAYVQPRTANSFAVCGVCIQNMYNRSQQRGSPNQQHNIGRAMPASDDCVDDWEGCRLTANSNRGKTGSTCHVRRQPGENKARRTSQTCSNQQSTTAQVD
jgi:hypothetical protein